MHDTETGKAQRKGVSKYLTGIQGLDEITEGGLPKGRSTLIVGGAGTGKTLIALGTVVNGIKSYGEPGVFMSFEESSDELAENVAGFGWDLEELREKGGLCLDYVRFDPEDYQIAGEFDLEGLFLRIKYNLESVGASRLVLDGMDTVFAAFRDQFHLRLEIKRLIRWLRDQEVSAILTCEQGTTTLTRQGVEEYITDCVIKLETRVFEENTTRKLRILKYRGSGHSPNEFPFLISRYGIILFPITSVLLDYPVKRERLASGIPGLDRMLGGRGIFQGSSVLVTGTAGTGKSSIACHFAQAACDRGEKVLYMSFEESPQQIVRNMNSVGLDLSRREGDGLLYFHSVRSTFQGLEPHLMQIYDLVQEVSPRLVVMDPVSTMDVSGTFNQVSSFLARLIDHLKSRGITLVFTCLLEIEGPTDTQLNVSSLMDTWVMVKRERLGNRFERSIYLIKSRGMDHSDSVHRLFITEKGLLVEDAASPDNGA